MARKLLQVQICFAINMRHKSNGKHAIRRMNELKLMFGNLIETKQEKLKRLKLEKKGKLLVKVEPEVDTESHFFSKNLTSSNFEVHAETVPEKAKKFSYKIIQIHKVMKDAVTQEQSLSKTLITDNGTKEADNFIDVEDDFKSSLRENYANDKIVETSSDNDKIIEENNLYENIVAVPLFYNAKKPSMFDELTEVICLSSKDYNENMKYPSVTKILNATMSEEAKEMLSRWEKKMIAKLGAKGFQIYRQELLQNGKHLHTAIQNYLLQKPLDLQEGIKSAFKSINNILKEISDVKAIESHVVHPKLHYRGYLDCVARYRGKLCIVDWKKSDKRKSSITSTYDAPLQVASYIGALNADEKYPFEIQNGLIVIAYSNGERATVHEISGDLLQLYWKSWLERLQKYHHDSDNVTTDTEIKTYLD